MVGENLQADARVDHSIADLKVRETLVRAVYVVDELDSPIQIMSRLLEDLPQTVLGRKNLDA
jgi:hypothetical protein